MLVKACLCSEEHYGSVASRWIGAPGEDLAKIAPDGGLVPGNFARRLREGPLALSLEITPPKTMLPGVLSRRATLLGGAVDAINVIQRPGRVPSLDASIALLQQDIDPVWHLVTRGRTRDEIATDLARAREAGLRNALCILGDHVPEHHVDSPTVREVVSMAHQALPGGLIGATFNQYAPGREKALLNLRRKCEAGATYVQTQPAFDPDAFAEVARWLHSELPGVAIVPMVIPLLSTNAVDRIESRLGIEVPGELRRVVAAGEESAWAGFERIVGGLIASGEVQGLAIMTFEMDPPQGTAERIVRALRRTA